MSLTDLKKKSTRSKVTRCSVDEFINNAESYAHGFDNVVSIATGRTATPLTLVDATATDKPQKQPYRRATFTLSEECIESLTLLSQQSGFSRSHLVRRLIKEVVDSKGNATLAQQ